MCVNGLNTPNDHFGLSVSYNECDVNQSTFDEDMYIQEAKLSLG